jgi:hypothetical protein
MFGQRMNASAVIPARRETASLDSGPAGFARAPE